MGETKHIAILVDNSSRIQDLANDLLNNKPIPGCEIVLRKKGMLFSRSEIDRFMDEEERHDIKVLTQGKPQRLKTMSSGEQKKALLAHLVALGPDFLVLVNPYDNLDVESQAQLREDLIRTAKSKILIQLVSRTDDILPITTHFFSLIDNNLVPHNSPKDFWAKNKQHTITFDGVIPPPIQSVKLPFKELVCFKNVSVSFDGRQVLDNINWTIEHGEFWQLVGPNGSGKTTLLSMITGDSHKGYGQNLTIFGHKKGSGESVWDLKENIGYFTPAMMDKFRGYHTLEHMIISGLHDSIGLYTQPTDAEKKVARQWLTLLRLIEKKDHLFKNSSSGEKRLIMMARAMVKHPPLLILDEPTAGLDDKSASFFVSLVNKIANESDTTLIYVSHRTEAGLHPQSIFQLHMKKTGSMGKVKNP